MTQFLLIPNRINKFMDLRENCPNPALISSARTGSVSGELCLFSFSVAISTSKVLGSGTSGSAVRISVCLTSLTPCTFNSWEMVPPLSQNTVGVCSQMTLLFLYYISSRLVTLLKSLMPLYMSVIFLILLLVSNSSILAFRYSFFLCLKCLLASLLTLFRLSTLLWFGSCNHCILAHFLCCKGQQHS